MPTQINMKRLGTGPAPSLAKGATANTQPKGNLNNVKENLNRSSRNVEATTSRQRAEAKSEGMRAEHIDIQA
jgi:hypothetical protein